MLSLLIRKAVLERKERGPDAADASGCWQREPHFYLPVLLRGLWGAVRRRGNLEFSMPPPPPRGVFRDGGTATKPRRKPLFPRKTFVNFPIPLLFTREEQMF